MPREALYIDESLSLTKSIKKKFYFGVGATIYNIGKELHYTSNSVENTLELQFNSIDFLVGMHLWKIYVEPKLSIVKRDFPGTIKDNATLIGLRIFYRFELDHSKHQ